MYCQKCGKELKDGAAFCPKCGAKQYPDDHPEHAPSDDAANTGGQTGQDPRPSKGNRAPMPNWAKLLIVIAAVVVVAAVVVIIVVSSNSRTAIDMNRYLVISEDGYEGYGTVSYHIDYGQLRSDYEGKLKLTSEGSSNDVYGPAVAEGKDPVDLIYDELDVYSTASSHLSNGDTVTFLWDDAAMNRLETYINVTFKSDSYDYIVSGLKEPETEDFFDYVTVGFSGTAPNGIVNVSIDCDWLDAVDFLISDKDGLSNGDVVTLMLDDDTLINIISSTGKVPTETEKEYTVEGLAEGSGGPAYVDYKIGDPLYDDGTVSFSITSLTENQDDGYDMSVRATSNGEKNNLIVTIEPYDTEAYNKYTGKVENGEEAWISPAASGVTFYMEMDGESEEFSGEFSWNARYIYYGVKIYGTTEEVTEENVEALLNNAGTEILLNTTLKIDVS